MVSSDSFGTSIDVWSVGCIMAEILVRKPIFPLMDWLNHMKLIIGMLRSQTESNLDFISNSRAMKYIESLTYSNGIKLSALFPKANPVAIDLLEKMLLFDPRKRITVAAVLRHPYMEDLYCNGPIICNESMMKM